MRNRKYKYCKYVLSSKWRSVSRNKRKQTPFCQCCGFTSDLVVHHMTYERVGKELSSDLCVLCKYCHDEFHTKYGKKLVMLHETLSFISKQSFEKKLSLLDY